jgi:hypothetical protein
MANPDFASSVQIPESVIVRELEGESVLLNLDTEMYYGLDNIGTRMWDELTSSSTIQNAYDTLLTKYEVAPDQLLHDLAALIEKLVEKGLIQLDPP